MSLDTLSVTSPALDPWAAATTADEILAASTAEEFYWLSPKSLVSDAASITTMSSIDTLNLDHQSMSLAFHDSSPEPVDLEDFYLGERQNVNNDFKLNSDEDATLFMGTQRVPAGSAMTSSITGVASVEDSGTMSAYDPEPFCSFEYSPEPVNLSEALDPYGFLDLAINI